MILEGAVSISQGNHTIYAKNHLTKNFARMALAVILGYSLWSSGSAYPAMPNYGPMILPGWLNTAYKIKLGTGSLTPSFDVTALSASVLNTPSNSLAVVSNYATGGYIDVNFTGTSTQAVLEAAFTLQTGTAQAGAADSITLSSGASGSSDIYNAKNVTIKSGTGLDQVRTISDYDGSTKVATITPNWDTNPDNTSVYTVYNPIKEMGLETYGGAMPTTYLWSSAVTPIGYTLQLLAYLSTTTPDFASTDINVGKALSIEWKLRVAFAAD